MVEKKKKNEQSTELNWVDLWACSSLGHLVEEKD
jgi:hypothetical protein